MPYLMSNLIQDVLPRVGRVEPQSGITLYGAATSVQSMIFKRLLNRKSDLLATGDLFVIIPAYDYRADLPSGFLSMAEKPRAVSAPLWYSTTAWMAGKVTSYNAATKTLVVDVTSLNGSGTLASWNVAVGVLPGQPAYTLDTSASSVAVGLGSKTFITATALTLVAGQNVVISNVVLPTDSEVRATMDPEYLDDDDHEDFSWWERYKFYGEIWETAGTKPRRYKVLGTNLYVRPKVTAPVMITGKYNASPTALTTPTQTIPWSGLFDEVFREGVVRILQKGISIPDSDEDFLRFIDRECETVINSRIRLIPSTRRLKRGNFM